MALSGLFNDPVALSLITLGLFALLLIQRRLGWQKYKRIHRAKVRLFPILQRLIPSYLFVSEKGYRDDAEYQDTWNRSVKATWHELTSIGVGGSPHLLSSIKRRETPEGPQYSAAHVVWTHADGKQTEAYLFENPDGTTDIYGHMETGVTDPEGHLSDPQTDGDPREVIPSKFVQEP